MGATWQKVAMTYPDPPPNYKFNLHTKPLCNSQLGLAIAMERILLGRPLEMKSAAAGWRALVPWEKATAMQTVSVPVI